MKYSVIYIYIFQFCLSCAFWQIRYEFQCIAHFYLNEVLSQKLKVVGSVLLQMEKNSTTTGKNKIKGVCIFSYSM